MANAVLDEYISQLELANEVLERQLLLIEQISLSEERMTSSQTGKEQVGY